MAVKKKTDRQDIEAHCSLPYFPRRYIITIMLFLGMLVSHAMRVNVAVTAVGIMEKDKKEGIGRLEDTVSMPSAKWTSSMVGFLHAIFYMGYIVTQLPAGYLCTVLPSHRLFGGCIMVSCSLNLLLPVCFERLGYTATCVIRVMQGLSEGLLFPGCYAVMSNWTIPEEKSRVGAFVVTGVYIGPFLGLAASGALTQYYGWFYVYYVHGAVGVLWFVVWLFLSFERPNRHPSMSVDELTYIEKKQGYHCVSVKGDTVPWKSIISSTPVYALCVANFARSFKFFFLLTNGPAYIHVFGFTLAANGIYSALPHAVMACIALASGPLADYLISSQTFSTSNVRKSFTCVGFGMESVCMLILKFVEDGITAIVFLTIGVGISGLAISGWQINHLDLAPRYASVLVALTTLVGTMAGIIMPVIVGLMTTLQTLDEWQNVFLLMSVVLAVSILIYGLFGSGRLQTWAAIQPFTKVVHSCRPFENPQYGTFSPQVDHGGNVGTDIVSTDDRQRI